ncbi:nuclear transport factor 2 family protein [Nitratidesulfovibrio sp.]|uniref:nuclear transport factor 2 family protein n=1 Tax=Nitratidesulfovibrio sp. TaxID=2802297 RepID=UPI00333F2E22
MTLNLPPAIAGYFAAANAHDGAAMVRHFAPDALVIDEQRERNGHAAIREWEEETYTQFHPRIEPQSVESYADETRVMGTVSGNFPGSPVVLRFVFRLSGGLITRLEITA